MTGVQTCALPILNRDARGILSYKTGVRSTKEISGRSRAFSLTAPRVPKIGTGVGEIVFTLSNSDPSVATDASVHKVKNAELYLKNDIYRLSYTIVGEGWEAVLLNEFCTAAPGEAVKIPVYVQAPASGSKKATLTLTAVSESDKSVKKQMIVDLRK